MDQQDPTRPHQKPSAPPVPRGMMSGRPAITRAVPKELLSARPAMTKVVPRSPDKIAAAAQAVNEPSEPSAEEIADRQARIDYLRGIREYAKGDEKSYKWLVLTIVALVVVLAGLAGAYSYLNKPTKPTAATTQPQAQTTQNTPAPAQTAGMKQYDSTNFSLGFKYPSDWTVSDNATALTVLSPATDLPGSAGQTVKGAVLMTIQHKQPSLPEFKTGNAVAVLDSKNVNYSAPATGQRGSTFLSYLQYNSTTTKGALDGIYITGNSGYKKTQTIPQADVIKVDPLVKVTFVNCTASCTPASQAMNVNGQSWLASKTNTTVESILTSLAFNG